MAIRDRISVTVEQAGKVISYDVIVRQSGGTVSWNRKDAGFVTVIAASQSGVPRRTLAFAEARIISIVEDREP